MDESRIEIISLELSHLTNQFDDKEFKRDIFKNSHVIAAEAEKDNITGLCNGKGKVEIRCKDKL